MPRAFFGTFFRAERKYFPLRGGSPTPAPESARQAPARAFLTAKLPCAATSRGLSSGQTIGAARTAVRSACCLPELRVISAFGGQPTGLIFPSVPPCTPSVSPSEKKPYAKSHPCAVVGASSPTGVVFLQQSWLAPQLAEGPSKLSNVITQKSIAAEINMSPLKIRLWRFSPIL